MDKIIEKEFESKQRMPVAMKKETVKEILKNLIMIIVFLMALSIMCFMDERLVKENYALGLKILSSVLVLFGVILLEISYRKDKFEITTWGGEAVLLGFIIMFVPYLSDYTKSFILGMTIGFGIYYIIKLLIIVWKKQKEFDSTKSDVKDLVKDDKKGYLDDVSKKKFSKVGNKKND